MRDSRTKVAVKRVTRLIANQARATTINKLPAQEQSWAWAFRSVLEVGTSFYEDTTPARKRYLEQHYRELATHNTSKGRKAAKIVALVVADRLGDRPRIDIKPSVPQPRLYGMRYHTLIADELGAP